MFHNPLPLSAQLSQISVLLWATERPALGTLLGLEEHTQLVAYLLESSVEAKPSSLHTIPHLHSAVITGS